ncbi:hypothetical protein [Subtercola sp. YIM 133946]|uniref:hypothetical protein n=1 Tax=Subtercola sp. YIM 133946 TaxID=3118909 RepID=UPI002F939BEA
MEDTMFNEMHAAPHGITAESEHPDADTFGLRVEQIADHAWRVSEGSDVPLPLLLGFVEERADGFEVMHLGDTFEWSIHNSLHEALHHLHDVAAKTEAGQVGSVLQWIT